MASRVQFKLMVLVLGAVLGFVVSLRLLIWIVIHPFSWYKKKDRSVTPDCLLDPTLGTHQYMTANGIKFHYVVKGERTKPLMLMIHGFPEFWFSWRYQLREFSKDYHVVAIDLRGYGDTERPPKQSDYEFDKLKQDVVELIAMFGYSKCTLVAHDWGGVIAWRVVQRHPELVENFIVMNCPHPKVYSKALSKSWKQVLKSWYIFLFQLPKIPEMVFAIEDYGALTKMFTHPPMGAISKDAFPPDVVEAYKYTFSQPGALTAPINYYRCMFNSKGGRDKPSGGNPPVKIAVPILLIWGDNDAALDVTMADQHTEVADNITIKHIPNCSHWVQQDQPETVNKYMREFLEEQQQ